MVSLFAHSIGHIVPPSVRAEGPEFCGERKLPVGICSTSETKPPETKNYSIRKKSRHNPQQKRAPDWLKTAGKPSPTENGPPPLCAPWNPSHDTERRQIVEKPAAGVMPCPWCPGSSYPSPLGKYGAYSPPRHWRWMWCWVRLYALHMLNVIS